MKFLDIVHSWAWALLVLACLAVGAAERNGRLTEKAAHLKTKADYAERETQRERIARIDQQEVARLQARHAATQQDHIHAFYQAQLDRARRAPARIADDRSVWNLARAYAASRGREAEGDSTSCRAAKAGLREVTDLLAEGHELAGQGAELIEERDAELKLWIGIGANDRALTVNSEASETPRPP